MPGVLVRSDFSRLFMYTGRAGPTATQGPSLQGLAKAGEIAWKQGDIKLVRVPSPKRYGGFDTVGVIPGDVGMPTLKATYKYTKELSATLNIVETGCPLDLQIHIGECQDPRDSNGGWDKVIVLENARITDYATDAIGALQPSERAEVLESIPFEGQDLYELKPLAFAKQATAQAIMEILKVTVCDVVDCGDCGAASDGCQVAFAVMVAATGSPGLPPGVLYTKNGGATWTVTHDTAVPANQDPTDGQCVGSYFVITSAAGISYAKSADILNAQDVWTLTTTGLVLPAGAPNKIWSDGPNLTWICGNGGYIYFTTDPTAGVTIQDAGVATTQNLNDIKGLGDGFTVMAVGATNAVVYTLNGGSTWVSVTGPNVGVNLTSCFMRSLYEWWVGDAAGKLWYTINQGVTWTQKAFPHSGTGTVRDIYFGSLGLHTVEGFMVADDGVTGRMFRSIDGGFSFYALPEGNATLPTVKRLNRIGTCFNQNVVFAGGLLSGTAGIILKGA